MESLRSRMGQNRTGQDGWKSRRKTAGKPELDMESDKDEVSEPNQGPVSVLEPEPDQKSVSDQKPRPDRNPVSISKPEVDERSGSDQIR